VIQVNIALGLEKMPSLEIVVQDTIVLVDLHLNKILRLNVQLELIAQLDLPVQDHVHLACIVILLGFLNLPDLVMPATIALKEQSRKIQLVPHRVEANVQKESIVKSEQKLLMKQVFKLDLNLLDLVQLEPMDVH
jgi:hypothetical protein